MRSEAPIAPRSWAAWLLASLFFFYAFATRVSPSVMVDALMRDLAIGAAVLGNLSAIYFYVYASLQIPLGVMLDRIGPARLLAGGALVAAAGCALFALSGSVTSAYAGRLLIGMGTASSWVGTLAVIAQNFPRRRFAVLAGGTQAFGMVGAIAGQVPLSMIVEAHGWRAGMWSLGIAGAVLGLLIFLVVRDRRAVAVRSIGSREGLRRAIGNAQTWLCGLFGMAMVGPLTAFAGLWAIPYLMQVHGMDRAGAAAIASLMFVAWAVGSPIMGAISDRLGRRKPVMVAGASAATILLCALPLMHHAPVGVLVALVIAAGLASSVYVVGITLARESNPDEISGTVLGLVNTLVVGSGAVLQPLIGYVLDQHWTGIITGGARIYSPEAFAWGLAVLPAACGLGAVAAMLAREKS